MSASEGRVQSRCACGEPLDEGVPYCDDWPLCVQSLPALPIGYRHGRWRVIDVLPTGKTPVWGWTTLGRVWPWSRVVIGGLWLDLPQRLTTLARERS